MTIDEMKRMARESLELWSSDAKGKAENVFSPNYLNHQEPTAVGGVKGVDLEGWKAIVAECHTAFSDFDVAILTQVAEGDLVATRWQFEGTQTGEYLGVHLPAGEPRGQVSRSIVSPMGRSSRAGSIGTSTACSRRLAYSIDPAVAYSLVVSSA